MSKRHDCLNELDKLNDEVRSYNNQLANERDADKASHLATELEIRRLEIEALERIAAGDLVPKNTL